MLYVDPSAVLKPFLREPASEIARELLAGGPWATAAHTYTEVRRGLCRALADRALRNAQRRFEEQWAATSVVDLDEKTCRRAAEIAKSTGIKSLGALHLSAAERVSGTEAFVTFDVRQANAARSLGWRVLGV
jgi:predicted nucleic acid-binding protein